MTEDARKARNRERLGQLNPVFRVMVVKTVLGVEGDGYRPRAQEAWRSPEDEEEAYERGDSHVKWGFHCATTPDGKPDALAVDLLDDDAPLNPSRGYVLSLARHARANGLDTGVAWGLPPNVKAALNAAIAAGVSAWAGKLGWDPTHLEIAGITIAQAKAGIRPGVPPVEGVHA